MKLGRASGQPKENNQAEETMQPEADLLAIHMTTRPMITVSVNNGSLQVDGIELAKYIKHGSITVRPGDDFQASEVTVTFLADRLRVNRSADPGQERMQLG